MNQIVPRRPLPQQGVPASRPTFDEIGKRGRQLVILVVVSFVGLVVWASMSRATPILDVPEHGPASIRDSHSHVESGHLQTGHAESGPSRICEDVLCGVALTQDACDACSLYRQTMTNDSMEHVSFHGYLIERGVALRATSNLPEIQNQLFTVAVARNEILRQVHEGLAVELCEPCDANARSFLDVDFAVERIPEGIILSYTSSRDDLVELLQVMLLSGSELPL